MKALLALVILVAGCAAPAATPSPTPLTRTIAGTFTLSQPGHVVRYSNATGCNGTGGYDDIKSGVDVVIKDDKSTIVGKAELVATPYDAAADPNQCVYDFTATVPDAPFYSVEVGHRGAVTYSRADLDKVGWQLEITLGG